MPRLPLLIRSPAARKLQEVLVIRQRFWTGVQVIVTRRQDEEQQGGRVGSTRQLFEKRDGLRVALFEVKAGGQPVSGIATVRVQSQGGTELPLSFRILLFIEQGLSERPMEIGSVRLGG